MKRPSMYDKHESSLKQFSDLFNAQEDNISLVMQIYQTENFRDDGVIVDTKTGKRITFDWEIRDKYFRSGKFRFSTAGQFERKLKKDEIGLSLQCDSNETAVLVGWHEDWLKEAPKTISLSTDTRTNERGTIRYTTNFKIFPYADISMFREMLIRALRKGTYNHSAF